MEESGSIVTVGIFPAITAPFSSKLIAARIPGSVTIPKTNAISREIEDTRREVERTMKSCGYSLVEQQPGMGFGAVCLTFEPRTSVTSTDAEMVEHAIFDIAERNNVLVAVAVTGCGLGEKF